MKTQFLFIALFVVLFANYSQAQEIQFIAATIDYGTIEKGSDPHREFTFTNTGKAPLVISNAKSSCGCTVPSYPKEPIMPGEGGTIKVKYNTNNTGSFTKYITLTTNDVNNTQTRLTIKGHINAPESKPAGSVASE